MNTPPSDPPRCEHGSPARYATVVDEHSKTARDPYGDVDGPLTLDHIDLLRDFRDDRADETGEPARFRLNFLHADTCRTLEKP